MFLKMRFHHCCFLLFHIKFYFNFFLDFIFVNFNASYHVLLCFYVSHLTVSL
ncbi:hypothetical protein BVRB_000350 [Beta vulgaris subsp. vulgaris]|uniref:Uncharacterized protein n=1 Tax=Beta vulgaris subsp. vulgaris TaxID=3555 RepID=A0A0J8B5N5_BETVV|nr:hypothetical protein BVRB_000350 [Beta vulgaris subsp. vulgaris]